LPLLQLQIMITDVHEKKKSTSKFGCCKNLQMQPCKP